MSTLKSDLKISLSAGSRMDTLLEQVEAQIMAHALEENRWNQSKAARELGVSRGTLRIKLKKQFGNKYIGERSE